MAHRSQRSTTAFYGEWLVACSLCNRWTRDRFRRWILPLIVVAALVAAWLSTGCCVGIIGGFLVAVAVGCHSLAPVLPRATGPRAAGVGQSFHMTKSRKTFLLRMSPELYEALEAWAQQELRSVNGQIEYVLTEAIRRRGRRVEEEGSSEDKPADARQP